MNEILNPFFPSIIVYLGIEFHRTLKQQQQQGSFSSSTVSLMFLIILLVNENKIPLSVV